MEHRFVALRFLEDENLCDRVYWYRTDFALKEGERVLAPVGTHDRLQCAVVERTLSATAENAPYDAALVKSVAAKYGARKLMAGDTPCLELGGVRYDEKRYTQFRRILIADRLPSDLSGLRAYGVTRFLPAGETSLEEIAEIETCVLLYGASARLQAENIFSAVRGNRGDVPQAVAERLYQKLTH